MSGWVLFGLGAYASGFLIVFDEGMEMRYPLSTCIMAALTWPVMFFL